MVCSKSLWNLLLFLQLKSVFLKKISPNIIAFYLFGILLLLLLLLFFSPKNGIVIGQIKLKYASIESLSTIKKTEKKNIDDLIQHIDTTIQSSQINTSQKPKITDSIPQQKKDTAVVKKDSIRRQAVHLKMNDKAKSFLHDFFKEISKNKRLSVLHYGDSQIESDRITSYIRQKMQVQFGGYGVGLIPATDIFNSFSFKQSFSDNFVRYTIFGGKKLKSRRYAAMASVSRFTKEIDTTKTNLDSLSVQTAWITIAPSKIAYSRARQFTRVTLHYNDCIVPVKLTVTQDQKIIKETNLITDAKQHAITLTFGSTPKKLKFEFSGKISPNICGFTLQGNSGITVSNIALRGSSGTFFRRIKFNDMSSMLQQDNAQMLILQFGGNSVVSFKDSVQVTNYANWFKRQIQTLRKAMPGKMIIVIGPSDMSKLNGTTYETYPFLPYTISEMKRIALEADAAYWDLYTAMGGYNSMPAWVEKRLAANDYVHFSTKGAKFIAQMFWNAFWSEYVQWKKNQK